MHIAQFFLKQLKRRLDRINDIESGASVSTKAWICGSFIGRNVQVSEGCKIYQSQIDGKVFIGRYTSIWGPNSILSGPMNGISIGSFCSIAHHVAMHESFHNLQRTTSYFIERNALGLPHPNHAEISHGPIVIGNDVWIGAGAKIMSGVSVGDGSVIGAGSVVTSDIPPYVVACGNPARIMRFRFDAETTEQIQSLEWWNWSLDRLRQDASLLAAVHSKGIKL